MAAAYEICMKDEVPPAYQERTQAIDKLARAKELELLFKDATEMSEEQYLVHKWFCQEIRNKYGIQ
ncbi:hypothetical protein SESBI_44507 [Sesbania bispinosa]|nr:hypothetical protein SESBI_44507 [Sesbania bispinosa]